MVPLQRGRSQGTPVRGVASVPPARAAPACIATGAGGLDWDVVQPLVAHHLGELALPIYIYTHYEKGIQAIEPRPG